MRSTAGSDVSSIVGFAVRLPVGSTVGSDIASRLCKFSTSDPAKTIVAQNRINSSYKMLSGHLNIRDRSNSNTMMTIYP